MSSARVFAARALVRQEKGGYSNLVLNQLLNRQPLASSDRAFVSRLFYGTLERLYTLDFLLAQVCERPLQKLDPAVRAVLRSGLYQARYMAVPTAVAINESVNTIRALGCGRASGTVNAVLHRAVQIDPEKFSFADELERLCVLQSVSRPVAEILAAAYGIQTAGDILAYFFRFSPTAIRVNTCRTSSAALQQRLEEDGFSVCAGPVADSLLVDFKGSPAANSAFEEGLFHVQGLASQYAAACLNARAGQKVLDLCAAPGGKSLTIAQHMHNSGQLFCCDAAANRLSLIEETLQRGGITIAQISRNDAAIYRNRFAQADRVLCDVPCSGLGIIGKKPDIRYKTLADLPQLYPVQKNILRTAARYLADGGRLVYSTCTLNPRENEEQIAAFLAEHPQFVCLPPELVLPGAQTGPFGTTLLPHLCGTDGFFVAILEKKES